MKRTPQQEPAQKSPQPPWDELAPHKVGVREFEERLQRLEPLFVKLEKCPMSSEAFSFPELLFLKFDRKRVKDTLRFHLCLGLLDRKQVAAGPQLENLKRKKQKIISFLVKEKPPAFVCYVLMEWLDSILGAIRLQESKEHRFKGDDCLAVSGAITELTTYFWRCQPSELLCRGVLYSESKIYHFIGKMIEQVTFPSCPACGKETHSFPYWKKVRSRDYYMKGKDKSKDKSTWKTREERRSKEVEADYKAYGITPLTPEEAANFPLFR